MNRDCNNIQATMVEVAGKPELLDDKDQQHLEHCEDCRRRVAHEVALARILSSARPPADPQLQARIATALAGVTARRRWLAAAPAAASLVLVMLGLGFLGGVPGGSFVSGLAGRAGGSWLLLVDSAVESLGGLATLARVVAELMPLSMGLASALVSVIGVAAVLGLTRRWRRLPAWLGRS